MRRRTFCASSLNRLRDASRSIAAMVLALTATLIAGCWERLPTYRYELAVHVDTPQGRRVGSAVTEVRAVTGPAFPGPEAGVVDEEITTEAVAVPLPNGENLFALVRPGVGRLAMVPAPGTPEADEADPSGVERYKAQIRQLASGDHAARLTPDQYPMLVRFRDRRDPTTVEKVDSADLSATFGPGYRLVGMTVRTTDQPPTRVLTKHLPWLVRNRGERRLISSQKKYVSELTEVEKLTFREFTQGE